MSKETITYRLAAVSDPAGKFNPDAPLNGNEDNFYVDDNLADNLTDCCRTDEILEMGELGLLMVVADGMGGMNAGEVASEIAIRTVKDAFAPGTVTAATANDANARKLYLEAIVTEADRRIKAEAETNPQLHGMGSTIILAWIVGDNLTLTWCGDSRAYRFNPLNGIEPLSTDHSYVQGLVNQGVITYEDTFEHPQGNIITRSLGDPNKPAQAESREFKLFTGDVILLCSDGLSGVLRDRLTFDHSGTPYAGENIEDIIADHCDSMKECSDALMAAAKDADWYDNVTVLLCRIVSGAPAAVKRIPTSMPPMPAAKKQPAPAPAPAAIPVAPATPPLQSHFPERPAVKKEKSSNNLLIIAVTALATLVIAGILLWFLMGKQSSADPQEIVDNFQSAISGTGTDSNDHSNNGNSGIQANASDRIAQERKRLINELYKDIVPELEPCAEYVKKEIKKADLNNPNELKRINEYIDQVQLRSELIKDINGLNLTDKTEENAKTLINTLSKEGILPPEIMKKLTKEVPEFIKKVNEDAQESENSGNDDQEIQPLVIENGMVTPGKLNNK